MSLEIVDELMTPGCPQCAVKHLSAALSYKARYFAQTAGLPPVEVENYEVLLACAYVNLGEVLIGYRSHLWFAVGLLQEAEEEGQCRGDCFGLRRAEVAREARLLLTADPENVRGAMNAIRQVVLSLKALELAHLQEAMRELPHLDAMVFLDYEGAIERIRKEYFDLPEAAVAEGETTTNQGEPEMATTKKAACKGGSCSPKGARCAEKGGTTSKVAKAAAKAAKACAKGGKCKK